MDSWVFLSFLINFQLTNEVRCNHSKSKTSGIIKWKLMTPYMIDPNKFQSA